LPACETVKGATRDLDQAGRAITTEARKAQAGL
jgi:predicted small secreted protein